jgi:ABC-2 type transport system ATP-binding protein
MIDDGRAVLYGNLREIKTKHRSHSVIVDCEGELGEIPGVAEKHAHKDHVELILDRDITPQQLLERLVSAGITINRFEITTPSLNEIFLEVAGNNHE